MDDKIELMRMEPTKSREESIQKLEEKLDPKRIKKLEKKTNKGAKFSLSYIEGHTAIEILNQTFNYNWSFEIISEQVFEAETSGSSPNRKIVKILGQLTVPGFGVKQQYGSSQLVGGPDVQEDAFKAAATDALKKCATLLGVAKELYNEDEKGAKQNTSGNQSSTNQSTGTNQNTGSSGKNTQNYNLKPEYTNEISSLKKKLGISDNSELNKYVEMATNGKNKTYKEIDNTNAQAVINQMKADLEE